MDSTTDARGGYKPPTLRVVGTVAELTLGCDKKFGFADGFTMHGDSIVCVSP